MKKWLVFILMTAMVFGCVNTISFAETMRSDGGEVWEQENFFEKVSGEDWERTEDGLIFSGVTDTTNGEVFHYVTSETIQLDTQEAKTNMDLTFGFRLSGTEPTIRVYFSDSKKSTMTLDDSASLAFFQLKKKNDGYGVTNGTQQQTMQFSAGTKAAAGAVHRDVEGTWSVRLNGCSLSLDSSKLEALNTADGFYVHIVAYASGETAEMGIIWTEWNGQLLGSQIGPKRWIQGIKNKVNQDDMYDEDTPEGHVFYGQSDYVEVEPRDPDDKNPVENPDVGTIATRNGIREDVYADIVGGSGMTLDGFSVSLRAETDGDKGRMYFMLSNMNWNNELINPDRLTPLEMSNFAWGTSIKVGFNPLTNEHDDSKVDITLCVPDFSLAQETHPDQIPAEDKFYTRVREFSSEEGYCPVDGGFVLTFIKKSGTEVGEGTWILLVNGRQLELGEYEEDVNLVLNTHEKLGGFPVVEFSQMEKVSEGGEPIPMKLILRGIGTQKAGGLEPHRYQVAQLDSPDKPASSDITSNSITFTFLAPTTEQYKSRYWTIDGFTVTRDEKVWNFSAEDELKVVDTELEPGKKHVYRINAFHTSVTGDKIVVAEYGNLIITTKRVTDTEEPNGNENQGGSSGGEKSGCGVVDSNGGSGPFVGLLAVGLLGLGMILFRKKTN